MRRDKKSKKIPERFQNFAKRRNALAWYTGDAEKLTPDVVVEHVLGCEDWEGVQGLLWALGVEEAARIFRKQARQDNCFYDIKTKHYFRLYFNKYAPLSKRKSCT
jgi:hypothetical protein